MRTKNLTLYLLAITALAVLVWDVSTRSASESAASDVNQVAQRSAMRESIHHQHRKRSTTRRPSSQFRPANIDANARLSALFENFPELATELHEPNPELEERFRKIFPQPSDPSFGSPYDFELMLIGDESWDAEKATAFLLKNEHRITELVSLINEFDDYEAIQFEGFHQAVRLLPTSYALNLKLGNEQQAKELYTASIKTSNNQADQNLIQTSFSIAISQSLGSYNLELFSEHPEMMHLLESTPKESHTMSKSMKAEFASCLRMIYDMSEIDRDGVPHFNMNEAVGDESELLTEKYITLDTVEDIVARKFINQITYLKECEDFDGYVSEDEITKELENSIKTQPPLPEIERQLAEVLFVGTGYYYEAMRDAQQMERVRRTAMQIAYAQHIGNQWDGQLPNNYKTGEPILWDQENHQLHTGLEDNQATVDIPVIE